MKSLKIYVRISTPIVHFTQLELRVQAMSHQAAKHGFWNLRQAWLCSKEAFTAAPPNNGQRDWLRLETVLPGPERNSQASQLTWPLNGWTAKWFSKCLVLMISLEIFFKDFLKNLQGYTHGYTCLAVLTCMLVETGFISYDFSIIKPQNAIAPHFFVKILNDFFWENVMRTLKD